MAEYRGFSILHNAAATSRNGLVPASQVGCGIPAALVKKHCRYAEWHQTSEQCDESEFFDPELVKSVFGFHGTSATGYDEKAAEALAIHKASISDSGEVYSNCSVEWLDRSEVTMNRQIFKTVTAEGCTVRIKGKIAHITFADGTNMTRRLLKPMA